jgi:hypothetical protein
MHYTTNQCLSLHQLANQSEFSTEHWLLIVTIIGVKIKCRPEDAPIQNPGVVLLHIALLEMKVYSPQTDWG